MATTEQLRQERDAAELELAEASRLLSAAQSRAAKARNRYQRAQLAYADQREQEDLIISNR